MCYGIIIPLFPQQCHFFRSDLKANRAASHVGTSQVVALALLLLVSYLYQDVYLFNITL